MSNIIKEKLILHLEIIICVIFAFILYGCTHKTGNSSMQADSHTETEASTIENTPPSVNKPVITIDPGHGGFDPGKVSVDGVKEKDINLAISLELKKSLENLGYIVYLTRTDDISLNDEGVANKKASDLNNRIKYASEMNSDLLVSIHQNSYSGEAIHGGQVFYYSSSKEGKELAGNIQEEIKKLDTTNTRMEKGNLEYLLLTKSKCTSVIVECGFLSNTNDKLLLCDNEYQKKLANAIATAIEVYYNNHN